MYDQIYEAEFLSRSSNVVKDAAKLDVSKEEVKALYHKVE